MAIQGFFTGDVKIKDLNGVLKAVDGIVEVATDAGTVTSVGIQLGTSGTDANVSNSPITSSGNITLNLPTASATNRGLLSTADWSTFNSKQGAITLTTTGSSGAATLIGTTLNIPNYSGALTGYVPYTGATTNVDLGEYGISSGYFQADLTPSGTLQVGRMQWNSTDGTMDLRLMGNNVTLQIGQEQVTRVVNGTGGNLLEANYQAVKIIGAQGQRLQVGLAKADSDANSKDTLGLVTETINNNQEGFITVSGLINEINTTGSLQGETWNDGDTLYLSGTTSGAITNVKPTAPIHTVIVGFVVYAHANHGKIYVKVDNGYELEELHDVAATPYVNKGVLYRDTATNLWKSATIGTLLGYTPANAATTLTINGTAYDISTNRTWSVGTVTSVAALTIGSSGTDLSSTVANGTTTPVITLNVPTASATNRGVLSAADWTAFNAKQAALTFSAPLVNTAGTISIPAATGSVNGYLTSTDWTTFNSKQAALSGTGFVKISGTTISYDNSTYYLASNPSSFIALTALSATAPLSYSNTTGVFSISQATTSTNGYLSSTDWNTFYNKQAAGSYITALTGEATASGPGSASVTLSTSAVTGKLLTGLNLTGGGSIAATDSILQAFGKVQNQISGLAGGVTYQGTWNASTNTPTLTSSVGTKGYYYIVDVAGSTNLNGITDWKIGDWAIFNGSTWDKVDNTDAVSSVNGFTGAVSLTTSNISEGTNLYYLDSRARLALSFTAGSGGYNNTTGVITIPTNTSQLTNGANFITLSSLSASSPLAYNSGTGAFSIQVATGAQNGYLSSTDWTTFNSKQAALTLTTTGSSGSATLVGATLNVPTYTLSGLGGVPTSRTLTINGTAYDLSADRSWSVGTHTGSLTSGYIPKSNGTTSLTDSLVYDTGSAVLIGSTTAGSGKFMVYSSTADNHYQAIGTAPSFRFADTIVSPSYTGIVGLATASNHFITGSVAGDMVLANNTSSVGNFLFGTGATERMRINATTGNVSIGNTGNTFKLEVTGTTKISGQLTLGSTITNGTYTYTLPSATGTIALVGGSGVGTVTSIATTGPITGGTITSTGTIGITQSGAASDGYLSSTDWNTFNNKQSALTNPVTGTGTTNYLPKFTGTSTIGNSGITDDGTTVTLISRALSGTTASFVSSGKILEVKQSSAGSASYYVFDNTIETSGKKWRFGYTGAVADASTFSLYNETDNVVNFVAKGGNLGLGVTPSAWYSATKALQINGGSMYASNTYTFIGSNTVYTSTGDQYINTGYATVYGQLNGEHRWYNAPSGTAGNAISFTQAMTLNASGNLSIGNTNDTYKLDVSGTGRFIANSTTVLINSTSRAIDITGKNNYYGLSVTGGSGTGTSYGAVISAGTNSSDVSFSVFNKAETVNYFQVRGDGAATFSSSVTATSTISTSDGFYSSRSGSDSIASGAYLQLASVGVIQANASNGVDFWTLSGSWQRRMTITQAGNVGIGTTSPSWLLQLEKNSSSSGAGQYPALVINNPNAAGYSAMYFFNGGTNVGGLEYSNSSSNLLLNSYGALLFQTASGNERMRITSGGDIGIGTTPSSDNRLQIFGKDSTSSNFAITIQNSSASVLFRVRNDGFINTGTASVSPYNNSTSGRTMVIESGGGLGYTSSTRESKTNINSIGSVDWLKTLNPVSFNYRKKDINRNYTDEFYNEVSYGFIADEVEKINPDFVFYDEVNGKKKLAGVKYESMTAVLVKMLQDQQSQINELKSQLNK